MVYKGVLREAIKQGDVDFSDSLRFLQEMRQELDISEQDHLAVITELGVEDPKLLHPAKQRSREDGLRLEGYREALLDKVAESWKQRPAEGLRFICQRDSEAQFAQLAPQTLQMKLIFSNGATSQWELGKKRYRHSKNC